MWSLWNEKKDALDKGQGKAIALLSTNVNVLSISAAWPHPPRLLVTRYRNIVAESVMLTLGQKAERGAESLLRKAESRAVDLPGPFG